MSNPTAEKFLTDLHVFAWDEIEIQVSQFKIGSESFSASITILANGEDLIDHGRLNLLASETRTRTARKLATIYPRVNAAEWDARLLYIAYTSGVEWREGTSKMIDLADVVLDKSIAPYLLPGLVAADGVTLTIGDASAGKSMFATAEALTICTGYPFLGVTPTQTGPIGYYDWEDGAQTIRERAQAMCEGAHVPFPAKRFHYREMDRPVSAADGRIHREVEELGLVFAVFDSVGAMLGGDPSDPMFVIPAVNAMRTLHIPSVGLHHLSAAAAASTRLEDKQKGYGSVYLRSGARYQILLDRFQDEEANEGRLFGFNTKVNRGKKSRPQSWALNYVNPADGFMESMTYTSVNASDYFDYVKAEEPASDMSVQEAVIAFLRQRTATGTAAYSVEILTQEVVKIRGRSVSEQTVRNKLNEGKARGLFVTFPAADRTGVVWALATPREDY